MGWKDWVYGDLVSAADFQSLVQDQTVQRYASSAARSAALGSAVAEGMVSYLDDTNSVEVYTGSGWDVVGGTGRNAILNSAFDIWQRGTSFSNPAVDAYTADRWKVSYNGTGATRTISQQTFTPGTAPVAGYEGQFFYRYAQSVAGTGGTFSNISQRIEDVRSFAGQTITISFWAKVDAARTVDIFAYQEFGTGGSAAVAAFNSTVSLTTSWTRYTVSGTMPSIAGKTIGTGSDLGLYIVLPVNTTFTFDIWGVQLEAGSSATPFKRNAPSIQGELAACQRYYFRNTADATLGVFCYGGAATTTVAYGVIQPPVTMRATPTSIDFSTISFSNFAGSNSPMSSLLLDGASNKSQILFIGTASGLTAGQIGTIRANNSSTAYLGFSAEL